MVTPRHHGWLHEEDYLGDRGCNDVEDWVNPQCCQQLWDLGFDDADSCREHYDEISYVDSYRDTWRLRIWEWAIGTLVIGGIVLILTLCCCWRRGFLCFSRCPYNRWKGCCCCEKQIAPEPVTTYQNTYANPQVMYNQQFVRNTNPDSNQNLPGFAPPPYQPQQTNFNQFK